MRLAVTPEQAEEIDRRFEAARQVYNAVLGEMKRRLKLMRQCRQWQKARKCRQDQKKRNSLFSATREQYGFSRIEAIRYARQIVRQAFRDRLNVNDADCLAKRAYGAVSKMMLGKSRNVRFKGRGRLRSLESDGPNHGVRYRNGCLLWRDLVLPVRNHHTGGRHGLRHQSLLERALQQRLCFARLIRQRHRSQVRYYVQLVLEGKPLLMAAGNEHLGIDLNVSSLAYAGENAAALLPIAPGLQEQARHVRRIQRHLNRQRRANNPENYRQDGTIKRGCRWKLSCRMRVVGDRLADLQRRQADQRQNENGRIANQVVRVGKNLKTEQVSVKGWQRTWGKQIGKKAPAGCMSRIARKAESAGGHLLTFPTRTTRLSQTCICGKVEKKSLGQRVHLCPSCGLQMHRDLLSAYLARFVEDGHLHADQALKAWSGAEPHLRTAWIEYQSASSGLRPDTRKGRSGSRAKVA